MKLTNVPLKGYSDWMPDEFNIRKYIFDTWRTVCCRFGYREYLTPMLEYADIYRAKSGEDAGNKELMIIKDRGGRELALRPEMTPSVTRMVTRFYEMSPKPIRLFSIANFIRNQKPQRGRNREFWQLNFDIFGTEDVLADIEILRVSIEIMMRFNPPDNSFTVYLNNRKLIDEIVSGEMSISDKQKVDVVRILDKWEKFDTDSLIKRLKNIGLDNKQVKCAQLFMESKDRNSLCKNFPNLYKNDGYKQILKVEEALGIYGYSKWIKFNPSIIRGFDYYDGIVFEFFDNSPENNRSLFGGGRYNGLSGLFGKSAFPAVGCAPGDEPTKLFLQSWNLIPDKLTLKSLYVAYFDEDTRFKSVGFVDRMRNEGVCVVESMNYGNFGKQMRIADKAKYDNVCLIGPKEVKENKVYVKDMITGKETIYKLF